MKYRKLSAFIFASLSCTFSIQTMAAASGQIQFHGSSFKVADALAYKTNDGVEVALLSSKLNRSEVAKDMKVDSFDVMRSDGSNLTLSISSEGEVNCLQFGGDGGGGSSCNSEFNSGLKITTRNAEKIAGTFNYKNAEDDINVSFDLAIESVAKRAGTALPANGGEPGKAALAHFGAIEKGDFNALKAGAHPDKRKMMEASEKSGEAKEMFEFMRKMMPTKVKILGGTVDGDNAMLDFEGMEGKSKVKGTVEVTREGAKWYVGSVNTSH